ncbi:MAG: 16S rRNA (cytosine(1402)-N(4))-methyltransferase RsmH [Patescibacteria group bacterium]|jgi:16S rRNA (cytosine1402-N4)-methyltransferase
MSNIHVPVLLKEVIEYLDPQPGQIFIDCTLGGGGYTVKIAEKVLPGGKVVAIDLDQRAIDGFAGKNDNIILVHDNFKNITNICHERGIDKINGVVLDLGLSSNQLADRGRGFSFEDQGFLDMRFDESEGSLTVFEIINQYPVERLKNIFSQLGEERLAGPISEIIHEIRQKAKIKNPKQLAEIISTVYRRFYRKPSEINPATKIFQALRIFVNQELENLQQVLPAAIDLLESGGRIAVVSFHSLEDRIVKDYFRQESKDCLCPADFPVCRCDHRAKIKILTKKPIVAKNDEVGFNPRSRSAKLRVAEKI